MNDNEEAFRHAVETICEKHWGDDALRREIICTPCEGAYGLAWWCIAINGSPPRGTLLISKDQINPHPAFPTVFLIDGDRARTLRGDSAKRLLRAASKFLPAGSRPSPICIPVPVPALES